MESNGATTPNISFAEFELDRAHRQLLRNGNPLSLYAKTFDLLSFLIERNGRIVTKDEILEAVWEGQFVEEANLSVQISALRKALGEKRASPRFLITVPGKGYKFVADLQHGNGNGEIVIEKHQFSRVVVNEEEESILPPAAVSRKRFLIFSAAVVGVGLIVAGLWFWNTPPKFANNTPAKLTKLTTSGRVLNATMSPDGKFAVFSQKDEGGEGLWLHQIESGSQTQIVPTKPLQYVGLTVSPDNQSIYASIFSKNEIDTQLVKIPIIGGVPQPIPNVVTGISVTMSPDGKRFAFTASDSSLRETYLGVSDADGSNSRFIVTAKDEIRRFKHFVSSPLAWSPDGAEVAAAIYDRTETGSQAAIIVVNPNDGSEKQLTKKRWNNVDNLAWLDSDRLAFIASEAEGLANQVWILSRQTGEAKQITNDLQSYNWLSATNGKLLAVKSNLFSSLRTADFDENAKTLANREVYNASENLDVIDWSSTGEILFVSRASGRPEIWQVNTDGSRRNQLTVDANVIYGLAVSPQDGSMIYGSQIRGKNGIWQIDSEGENLRQLSDGSDHSPDVSDDGAVVFQRGFNNSDGVFLTSRNEPSPRLLKEKCIFPTISSDGTLTACYFMDWDVSQKWSIALISNETGEFLRRLTLPISVYSRWIRFHPSGKYITQIITNGENLDLLLIPVDGSETQIIDGLGKGRSHLPQWSADGKQFLYPLITEMRDAVLLTDL